MDFTHASLIISAATIAFFGLIWLGIAAFLRLRKGKSFTYLLFFTVFYAYLYKVIDYTLLQFQSLLLLKHFLPNLMLRGAEGGRSVNLIPLITLTPQDIKTSLLNVLLMMPFGFGLPFITNFRMKKVVAAGLLASIAIELLQFATGYVADMTFRVADVNDLIFNTIGVAIGYILFVAFAHICARAFRNRDMRIPVLRYIAERPQIDVRRDLKAMYAVIAAFIIVAAALYGVVARVPSAQPARLGGNNTPQGGDPCGGTGGNGQVISVENGSFVMERNDGRSQTVNLAAGAALHAPAGTGSVSDLKTGDRITLVGGPNPDGSFTADDVFVCAAPDPESRRGQ